MLAANQGIKLRGETLNEVFIDLKIKSNKDQKVDTKRSKIVQRKQETLQRWGGFQLMFPPVNSVENTEENQPIKQTNNKEQSFSK